MTGQALEACALCWTTHACDRVSGHGGDHLCLGYDAHSLTFWGREWCQHVGLVSGQWAEWRAVCEREPDGSPRLFV